MDPREQRLREIDETLEKLAEDRTYRPSRMPPPPLDTRDVGAVDDELTRLGEGVGVPSAPAAAAALGLPASHGEGPPLAATRNGMDVAEGPVAAEPRTDGESAGVDDGSGGSLDKRSLVALFGEDPDDPDAGSVVSLLPDPPDDGLARARARSSRPPLVGVSSRPPSGPPSATFRRPREDAPAAPTPLPRPPWDQPTDHPPTSDRPASADRGGLPDAASLWPPVRSSSVPAPDGGPDRPSADADAGPPVGTPAHPPTRRSTPPPLPPGPSARSIPPPVPPDRSTAPPAGPAGGEDDGFGDMRPTPLRPVPVDPAVAARVEPARPPGPTGEPPKAPGGPYGAGGEDDADELSMELDDLLIIDEGSAAEPLPGRSFPPAPPAPPVSASVEPSAPSGTGEVTEYEDALDDLLHVTTDDDAAASSQPRAASAHQDPIAASARFASWPDVAAADPSGPPTADEAEVLSEDSVARSVSFAPDDTAAGVDVPHIPPMPPAVDVQGLDVSVSDDDEGTGEAGEGDRKGFFRRIFGKK